MYKRQKEWFAAHGRDDIAMAPNAATRKKMIETLEVSDDPAERLLYAAFKADLRQAEGESQLLRASGRYPLCGRGDVNTYAVFAELKRSLLSPQGRVACIVPSGIATDDTTKWFFQDLVDSGTLHSLYDFQSGPGYFSDIGHARFKYCLLTLAATVSNADRPMDFVFFARDPVHLKDPARHFTLTAADIDLLNPNTHTCPIFRSKYDAEITKGIYRRVPVLIKEGSPEWNPWGISFMAMFHMAGASHLFRTREQLEHLGWELRGSIFRRGDQTYVPLYEAKMVHQFDHRWATYEGLETRYVIEAEKADPSFVALSRYWVAQRDVNDRLADKWDKRWLLGWRDICRSTDERTVVASFLPRVACGDKFLLMYPTVDPAQASCLLAVLDSFCFDYIARQKLGGTSLKYYTMKQLPVLPPSAFDEACPWSPVETLREWVVARVTELVCTSDDMAPLAADLGLLVSPASPPHWSAERRFQLRSELDAAFFHLYGLSPEEIDHVMDTFHIVKRKDEAQFGEYRTKLAVLVEYDAMVSASERRDVAQERTPW